MINEQKEISKNSSPNPPKTKINNYLKQEKSVVWSDQAEKENQNLIQTLKNKHIFEVNPRNFQGMNPNLLKNIPSAGKPLQRI